jgi:hypothetical protein
MTVIHIFNLIVEFVRSKGKPAKIAEV